MLADRPTVSSVAGGHGQHPEIGRDAGGLVLAPETTEVPQLSTPGDEIWELLGEPLTVLELVDALATHYGESPESIPAPILAVLSALIDGDAVLVVAADDDRHD